MLPGKDLSTATWTRCRCKTTHAEILYCSVLQINVCVVFRVRMQDMSRQNMRKIARYKHRTCEGVHLESSELTSTARKPLWPVLRLC